jgi:hypothetical protein
MEKTLQEKVTEASERAAHFLAEGNEAAERNQQDKAEKLYAKSQHWLDRMNKLLGNS